MDSILAFLRRPQVHAALGTLSLLAGIFWPQYKPILDQLALAGAYGGTVTGIETMLNVTGTKK